jgi:uncharacterized protein (TIRG00374 family)
MKALIITLVKLLITGLFFFYIFGKVDFHQFAGTMRGARIGLLAGALLTIWIGQFICVLRWRILMRPLMPVPTLLRLCGVYGIGMFFNLTFPTIIGGDAVKVYYAGKPSRSYAESFASIFLDRDIGMFAMMIIACCAALFYPVSVPGVPITLILWIVFIFFVLGNIAVFTPRFHRLSSMLLRKLRLEKIAVKIDNIAKAFRIIGGHPAALWQSLGISFVNQFLVCAAAWIIALSLDIRISWFYFLIFVPLITLISMIPVSLNGMGLREYSFMSLFGAIGVAGESCIALGLLYSLVVILSSLPGGVVYILLKPNFRQILYK